MHLARLIIGGLSCLVFTEPAWAQASSNATVVADDAFGYTVGDDTVGIYDQSSVRGFDLESAGNYRINGGYFVKSSGVSNFFVESTAVRIGYNTFQLNLPGPSGVVDYRLRDPARGDPTLLTVGLDEYVQPYIDLNFKHRSANERFSTSLGLGLVLNSRDAQGGEGSSWLVAGTARINIGATGKARLFFGEYDYRRQGQFRVGITGETLPPRIARGRYLGQDWARERGQRRIAGVLTDAALGNGWSIAATAVFSQEDPSRAFSQFFTELRTDDTVRSTIVASPQQRATAWSGEGRINWEGQSGTITHKITALGRARRSRTLFGGDTVIDLGRVSYGARPPAISPPDLSTAHATLSDSVNQWGVGLTYQASWRDRMRLNAGVLRSDYRKTFEASDGGRTSSTSIPLLYNIGVLARVTDRLETYASYSRGLEEAGTAPASATNRNTVLNAIVATQAELGVRYTIQPGLTAIVAGFQTEKPYAGLEGATNIFALIGTVRHRGIEASLSGEIAPGLSVVAGGVYLRPRLAGDAVDRALIGNLPVGVPSLRAIGNASYSIPGVDGLSVDLGVEYTGPQAARAGLNSSDAQQTVLPSNFTVDAGVRYRFQLGNRPLTARLQIFNATNSYGWQVNGAETLDYTAPRRFRLAVTSEF
jgi:iron complex outermembrane recepter protein